MYKFIYKNEIFYDEILKKEYNVNNKIIPINKCEIYEESPLKDLNNNTIFENDFIISKELNLFGIVKKFAGKFFIYYKNFNGLEETAMLLTDIISEKSLIIHDFDIIQNLMREIS